MATRLIHILILVLLCFGVYSNNYHHEYNLDSSHVIKNNPSVRRLENIPRYFVDASAFSTLRSNVDYRPVLLASYAINYAMGGYDTWWWHATQILLHVVCTAGLYFLCQKIILLSSWRESGINGVQIAFVAALLFALHPTASGVVNYLSARSSLLTAAFLFPAIVVYMASLREENYEKIPWLAAMLFALALFTKVEAVGAIAVFFLCEVWQQARFHSHQRNFFGDLYHSFNITTLRRMAPILGATVVYFGVRQIVMAPFPLSEASHSADVGTFEYFITQVVVWWHYVLSWFAPVNLIADNFSYPVYRTILDPPVLLATGGWVLVTTFGLALWRRQPYLLFVLASGLALLSPTSSVVPLSEMLNEHRPYMPLAIISLAWIIPVCRFAGLTAFRRAGVRAGFVSGLVLVLLSLGMMTYDRNLVYRTAESYWRDVVNKAPSPRAYVNYGLTFMRKSQYSQALDYFNKSLAKAPYWYITHTNLAIIHDTLGDVDRALDHYAKAVAYDRYTGSALSWRGEYYLSKGMYREALDDFERSLPQSVQYYRNFKGLATAYAGLGNAEESYAYTVKCLGIDRQTTELDIVSIITPFFLDRALIQAGLDYFDKLKQHVPDAWWVYANISTLAARLGREELARKSQAMAATLKRREAK